MYQQYSAQQHLRNFAPQISYQNTQSQPFQFGQMSHMNVVPRIGQNNVIQTPQQHQYINKQSRVSPQNYFQTQEEKIANARNRIRTQEFLPIQHPYPFAPYQQQILKAITDQSDVDFKTEAFSDVQSVQNNDEWSENTAYQQQVDEERNKFEKVKKILEDELQQKEKSIQNYEQKYQKTDQSIQLLISQNQELNQINDFLKLTQKAQENKSTIQSLQNKFTTQEKCIRETEELLKLKQIEFQNLQSKQKKIVQSPVQIKEVQKVVINQESERSPKAQPLNLLKEVGGQSQIKAYIQIAYFKIQQELNSKEFLGNFELIKDLHRKYMIATFQGEPISLQDIGYIFKLSKINKQQFNIYQSTLIKNLKIFSHVDNKIWVTINEKLNDYLKNLFQYVIHEAQPQGMKSSQELNKACINIYTQPNEIYYL